MIKTFYFNDLRTCCYVLWDETKDCVFVDPGFVSETEQNRLVKFVEENELTPRMIINTHGHFDHVMGNVFVTQKWDIPTSMNHGDLDILLRVSSYSEMFGYKVQQPRGDVEDIKDGDVIAFGETKLKAFHTPGHSRGGVILYNEAENYVITGDSLFAGSIGRTDLPGGDYDVLMDSVNKKIVSLPSDTTVYPGHGPSSTIGQEIATNPFLERPS